MDNVAADVPYDNSFDMTYELDGAVIENLAEVGVSCYLNMQKRLF